jgi:ATP-dependent protease Clp ATPase subunit
MSYKVGARGLSIALRKMLSPVMYEAPDHRDCRCAKLSLKGGEIFAEWISSFKEAML